MTSAEIDHAVRTQLDGHGSIYTLDEEKLRELRPDLILTQELCDVCAVSYKEVRDAAARISEGEIKAADVEAALGIAGAELKSRVMRAVAGQERHGILEVRIGEAPKELGLGDLIELTSKGELVIRCWVAEA